MKQPFILLAVLIFLASCGGYFGPDNRFDSKTGMKPLALIGGGTLSDDFAQDESPFLFRYNGRSYLAFSSDRGTPGDMNLWYAEMDATEIFYSPVKIDNTNINTTNMETCPNIFTYNGTNYLVFLRVSAGSCSVETWILSNDLTPINQIGSTELGSGYPAIGLLQDQANPKLLVATATTNVKVYGFDGFAWNPAPDLNFSIPLASISGFRENGIDYYIASSIRIVFGTHQLLAGNSDMNSIEPVPYFASPFNDFTPFVDPVTYKIYFESDRYGLGNFDLYRYNIFTYDYLMVTTPPNTNLAFEGVYVSLTGDDTNNGTNVSSPLKTISKAVALAAQLNLTNVSVATGVYTPGNGLDPTGAGLLITNTNITIIGGCDPVTFVYYGSYSELEGNGTLKHVVQFQSAYEIYMIGFIIRGGNANGTSYPDNTGAGILFANSSNSYLANVYVTNCSAEKGGGLGYFMSENCGVGASYINKNTASINGGGCYFESSHDNSISSSEISGNYAFYGAGIYVYNQVSNVFYGNKIANNTAGGFGGAFYFQSSPSGEISYCDMTNNSSSNENSVIYLYASGNDPSFILLMNTFGGNPAYPGTAIYEFADVSNHTIANNYFVSNSLSNLYYDYLSGYITNALASLAQLNNPNFMGASNAIGNLYLP